MQISVWQISTVILVTLLLGQNLTTRPRQANAAASDTFGSPQVAVTSYKNQKGNFILWADGHISRVDAPDTTVSTLSASIPIPADEDPPPTVTRDESRPQGSPNVPVGVYQNGIGTYLLFADGSYKKPSGDAAAASSVPSVRSCQFDGTTGQNLGDQSLVISRTSPGRYNVVFDPPFAKLPTVTVTAAAHHTLSGVMPGTLTKNGCSLWTSELGGPHGWSDFYCGFALTVVGD